MILGSTKVPSIGPATAGLAAGLVAGLAMVAFQVAGRAIWGVPGVFELALVRANPVESKVLLGALLASQVLAAGGLGAAYGVFAARRPAGPLREWVAATALALAIWLGGVVLLAPSGLSGSASPLGVGLAAHLIYGLTLGKLFSRLIRPSAQLRYASGRRAFLLQFAAWSLLAVAAACGVRPPAAGSPSETNPGVAPDSGPPLATETTPNSEFFRVSKNEADPVVEPSGWSLQVAGLVEEPLALSYEDLKAMPSVEQFTTLECVGNIVGGELIGNARWRGVPLRVILERARLKPGVRDVSFRAADGYTDGVSLSRALSDEVMVAYEMNGEPLPDSHGFPARLLVPPLYGYKSVKWLTGIEAVDHDFMGFWERRGRTDHPVIKTMSKFVRPESGSVLPIEPVVLAGVAFSGGRGIVAVEVSSDSGKTWTPVRRISTPPSPYTWVSWEAGYEPQATRRATLTVRATDGQGVVQTSTVKSVYPDGATGRHSIRLEFRDEAG
jgi:DMSO/TMAO reductase YedYZ molybdopterin-dependent catalytic subunit